MRTVKLSYVIERKDKFFLIYIKDTKYLESLEIPINVTDELYSLSLTVSDYSNVGEQLCIKLRDTFLRIWNYSYGIPQIVFTGDTSKLKDEYKNAPVFIFFTFDNKSYAEQANLWRNQIRFSTKFTFTCIESNGRSFTTKDHNLVEAWFDQYEQGINGSSEPLASRYDFKKIMHDWYLTDGLDKKLMNAADEVIAMFVFARSYSNDIPAYLVVPIYHYKRYGHAVKILMSSFKTKFIMSLPLEVDNKSYTVLFPIVDEN